VTHPYGLGEMVTAWANRRPIVGVIVGCGGVLLSGAMLVFALGDIGRHASLRLEEVRLADCRPMDDDEVRWVSLVNGRLRCDLADVREEEDPLARLVRGRVDQVLVPVEGDGGRMPVVLLFDDAVDCPALGWPQVGILGNERATRGFLTPSMLAKLRGPQPLVLVVGDTPSTPWILVGGGALMLAAALFLILNFGRRMRRGQIE